jgi:hypothetical protein
MHKVLPVVDGLLVALGIKETALLPQVQTKIAELRKIASALPASKEGDGGEDSGEEEDQVEAGSENPPPAKKAKTGASGSAGTTGKATMFGNKMGDDDMKKIYGHSKRRGGTVAGSVRTAATATSSKKRRGSG